MDHPTIEINEKRFYLTAGNEILCVTTPGHNGRVNEVVLAGEELEKLREFLNDNK